MAEETIDHPLPVERSDVSALIELSIAFACPYNFTNKPESTVGRKI
jgi:hypothetical protein